MNDQATHTIRVHLVDKTHIDIEVGPDEDFLRKTEEALTDAGRTLNDLDYWTILIE